MKPNDSSILSAYLDDRLTPGERADFEACLAHDGELAHELESLQATTQRVRDLARPQPPRDLSGAVVARIVSARLDRESTTLAASRRLHRGWYVLSPLAAVAASLLFVWASSNIEHPEENAARVLPAPARPTEAIAVRPPEPEAPTVAPSPAPSLPPVAAPDLSMQLADQAHLRKMLEGDRIRQFVLDCPDLSPKLLERIDQAVNRSPRTTPIHARVDAVPGQAGSDLDRTYVLSLDPREFGALRRELLQVVPSATLRWLPDDPASLALVAEAGRVDFVEVAPRSIVTPPLAPVDLITDRSTLPPSVIAASPSGGNTRDSALPGPPNPSRLILDASMFEARPDGPTSTDRMLSELLGLSGRDVEEPATFVVRVTRSSAP